MNERKKKGTRWLGLVTAILLLGILIGFAREPKPAVAQMVGTCMEDQCMDANNYTCTANDVRVTFISVKETIDYCTAIGDTGEYVFELEFLAGANTRYDPTVWLALDGGDARNGQCYRDYLGPEIVTAGLPEPPLDLYGPPWWDLDSDYCGDIRQTQFTYKETAPVQIFCNQNLMDNQMMSAVIAWDNQSEINCEVGGTCPGTPSKCNAEDVMVEIKPDPVDLSLTKAASEIPSYEEPAVGSYIKPGDIFKYTLTVTNEETDPARFSIGFQIWDDLPIWLQVIEDPGALEPGYEFPAVCEFYEDDGDATKDGPWGDNAAEWCADDPGCNGYGDIIYCRDLEDLPAGDSRSYEFWVKFWDLSPEGHCDTYPQDPRCLPGENDVNPETIYNEACVRGNDREPTAEEFAFAREGSWANNCDFDNVPTDVELQYFTATGKKLSIELNWATTSETNNAGFNLYRSTSEDGPRIKLNSVVIPSQSPGGGSGAEYSFTDTMIGKNGVKRNTLYFYWLEDVPLTGDVEVFGPESASLTLGNLFKGKK